MWCVKHVRYRRRSREGGIRYDYTPHTVFTRTKRHQLHRKPMKTERGRRRRRCRRHQLFTVSRAMPEDRSAWMVSCSICYCARITWIALSKTPDSFLFLFFFFHFFKVAFDWNIRVLSWLTKLKSTWDTLRMNLLNIFRDSDQT